MKGVADRRRSMTMPPSAFLFPYISLHHAATRVPTDLHA